jgi:hypothetical protein
VSTSRKAEVREFSIRMVWAGDHWDVALTEVADGRTYLLATIPLDDWIGLSATQYVLEMEAEGAADATPTREPLDRSGRGSRNTARVVGPPADATTIWSKWVLAVSRRAVQFAAIFG